MNIELKPIAESKVRQLGGTPCGVLVRKDEKLAAVDEHGRVTWLGEEAARAQSGQGVEPVGHLHNRPERIPCFFETLDDARLSGCEVVPVYVQPQPAQPEDVDLKWNWVKVRPQPPQEGEGDEH